MKLRFVGTCVVVMILLSVAFVSQGLCSENTRPEQPVISGPVTCKVGIRCEWSFSSVDVDGDNLTYYVDWGDECGGAEWHGPYPSGEEVLLGHTYTAKNTLNINAMAVDEHGAESNMSYFEVTIEKSRLINLGLMNLFESFSHVWFVQMLLHFIH